MKHFFQMEQGLLKKFPVCFVFCRNSKLRDSMFYNKSECTSGGVLFVQCSFQFSKLAHGPLICLPQESIFFIQFRATFYSQTAIYMLFNNICNTNMLQNVFLNNCDANGLKIFTCDSPSVCKGLCQITPHTKITRIKIRLCWIPGCQKSMTDNFIVSEMRVSELFQWIYSAWRNAILHKKYATMHAHC